MKNLVNTLKESILEIPFVYNTVQHLFASDESFKRLATYIDIGNGETMLDIGCGTANIVRYLPDIVYYGFDPNPDYILKAKETYQNSSKIKLVCSNVSNETLPEELHGSCDRVLAIGVLHHLNESEVSDLMKLAKQALKPNGILLTVDPSFVPNQSIVAKILVGADRGKYVRQFEQYIELHNKYFSGELMFYHDNLNQLPYNHIVIKSKKI